MNLDRVNDFAGRWWHLLVSFAAIVVVGVMGFVFLSVADDRAEQQKDREVAEETNRQLAQIIKTEREQQDTRDERLSAAVAQVRQVLAEEIAKHDAQMNRLMARQLQQIDALIRRPQGTSSDPVTARSQAPAPAPAPSPPPTPPATSAPEPAPEPTSPRQRSCDRHPSGPHC